MLVRSLQSSETYRDARTHTKFSEDVAASGVHARTSKYIFISRPLICYHSRQIKIKLLYLQLNKARVAQRLRYVLV